MAAEILRPDADGTFTNIGSQYFPHWAQVDEVVADDSATWVMAYGGYDTSRTFQTDTYNLPNTIPEASVISSITVYWRGALYIGYESTPPYPTNYGKSVIYINGVTSYGAQREFWGSNLGWNAWTTYSDTWNTNPATGMAWTKADIDNLEIGVSLTYYRGVSSSYATATQVYVVVNYTPAVNVTVDAPKVRLGTRIQRWDE